MDKICKKCSIKKNINCFYKHSGMKDGHLNFCKKCVGIRVSNYSKTTNGRLVEKKRNAKENRKIFQREHSKRMRDKYKLKYKCRNIFYKHFKKNNIKKLPCNICGTMENVEAHHADYNKPLCITWLCSLHHKEWHRNNTAIDPIK